MEIITIIQTQIATITLAMVITSVIVALIKTGILAVLKAIWLLITKSVRRFFNNIFVKKKTAYQLSPKDSVSHTSSISCITKKKRIKLNLFWIIQGDFQTTEKKEHNISQGGSKDPTK